MQISRHWRMNANRYRLEGFALSNGEKSLQPRQTVKTQQAVKAAATETKTQEQRALTAA
jgi:hypothetical protein